MEIGLEKLKRLFRRYPEVFKGKKFEGQPFRQVYEQTEGYGDLTVFYYDKDIVHYIVAALIMKEKRYMDINFMNAYQLIDIYLGHVEEITCLSNIDNEVVAVYDGVGMPNKQKGNILIQVIEQQRMRSNKFWLFYKGTPQKLNTMYTEVAEIIKDDNFKVLQYTVQGASEKKKQMYQDEEEF